MEINDNSINKEVHLENNSIFNEKEMYSNVVFSNNALKQKFDKMMLKLKGDYGLEY